MISISIEQLDYKTKADKQSPKTTKATSRNPTLTLLYARFVELNINCLSIQVQHVLNSQPLTSEIHIDSLGISVEGNPKDTKSSEIRAQVLDMQLFLADTKDLDNRLMQTTIPKLLTNCTIDASGKCVEEFQLRGDPEKTITISISSLQRVVNLSKAPNNDIATSKTEEKKGNLGKQFLRLPNIGSCGDLRVAFQCSIKEGIPHQLEAKVNVLSDGILMKKSGKEKCELQIKMVDWELSADNQTSICASPEVNIKTNFQFDDSTNDGSVQVSVDSKSIIFTYTPALYDLYTRYIVPRRSRSAKSSSQMIHVSELLFNCNSIECFICPDSNAEKKLLHFVIQDTQVLDQRLSFLKMTIDSPDHLIEAEKYVLKVVNFRADLRENSFQLEQCEYAKQSKQLSIQTPDSLPNHIVQVQSFNLQKLGQDLDLQLQSLHLHWNLLRTSDLVSYFSSFQRQVQQLCQPFSSSKASSSSSNRCMNVRIQTVQCEFQITRTISITSLLSEITGNAKSFQIKTLVIEAPENCIGKFIQCQHLVIQQEKPLQLSCLVEKCEIHFPPRLYMKYIFLTLNNSIKQVKAAFSAAPSRRKQEIRYIHLQTHKLTLLIPFRQHPDFFIQTTTASVQFQYSETEQEQDFTNPVIRFNATSIRKSQHLSMANIESFTIQSRHTVISKPPSHLQISGAPIVVACSKPILNFCAETDLLLVAEFLERINEIVSSPVAEKKTKMRWHDTLRQQLQTKVNLELTNLEISCQATTVLNSPSIELQVELVQFTGSTTSTHLYAHEFHLWLNFHHQHDENPKLPVIYCPNFAIGCECEWEESYAGASTLNLQVALRVEGTPMNPFMAKSTPTVPKEGYTIIGLRWEKCFPVVEAFLKAIQGCRSLKLSSSDNAPRSNMLNAVEMEVVTDLISVVWYDGSLEYDAMLLSCANFVARGILMKQSSGKLKLAASSCNLSCLRGYLLQPLASSSSESDLFDSISKGSWYFPFAKHQQADFFLEILTLDHSSGFSSQLTAEIQFPIPLTSPSASTTYTPSLLSFQQNHKRLRPAAEDLPHDPNDPSQLPSPIKAVQQKHISWPKLKHMLSMEKKKEQPALVKGVKFLWTLTTRDSIFYTWHVITDDTNQLLERDHEAASSDTVKMTTASTSAASAVNTNKLVKPPTPQGISLMEMLQSGQFTNAETMSKLKTPRRSSLSFRRHSNMEKEEQEEQEVQEEWTATRLEVTALNVQIHLRDEFSQSSTVIASNKVKVLYEKDQDDLMKYMSVDFAAKRLGAYIGPTDVDVAAGVQWLNLNKEDDMPEEGTLLRRVLEDTQMNCRFLLNQPLALSPQKDNSGSSSKVARGRFELHLAKINLTLDRNQFFQLMGVIKHVLLAPPIQHTDSNGRKVGRKSSNLGEHNVLSNIIAQDSSSKLSKHQLIGKIEDGLRANVVQRSTAASLIRVIEYHLESIEWNLHLGPEMMNIGMAGYDFAQIIIRGVQGQHSFYANAAVQFNCIVEWIEINNLRPGPSSITFDDAMAVLKPEIVQVSASSKKNVHVQMSSAQQKGMLSIRAESNAPFQLQKHQITVYDVLEISIFPGISSSLAIQLGADLYEILSKFFDLDESGNADDEAWDEHSSEKTSQELLFGIKNPMRTKAKHSEARATTSPLDVLDAESEAAISEPQNSVKSELGYFRYVRIGKVCLRINCNGFLVNLRKFDLEVQPFVRRGKLWSWKRFVSKFMSHLKWYISTETATSGLSHFKNKLKMHLQSESRKARKQRQRGSHDKAEFATNGQLLFGTFHVDQDDGV